MNKQNEIIPHIMEDHSSLMDSLFERATEYGKTSFDLVKLKFVDKTSERISTFLPQIIIMLILSVVLLFINLGVVCWLGKIFGEFFYGFFAVAAFYILLSLVIYLFLRKWLKRVFYDYFVKLFLN